VFERAILSPSDVTRAATTLSKIRVGGRVVSGSARTFTLGDALGTIAVETGGDQPLAPGFLVVFDGTWDGNVLRAATLVWHRATELSAADGEFARLAWHGTGRHLVQRSLALGQVRSHFDAEHFVEVQTPTRVRAPGLDANVEPIRAQGGWLVTSPELHLKRLLTGGIPRVFEIARCHRDEEIGRYHEPEFTLIEWYRAFEPVTAVMRDTEQLVQLVVQRLSGGTVIEHAGRRVDIELPFARLSVAEAFERYARRRDGNELAERDPDEWFRLWVNLIEPAIAEFQRPVFVIDYPISQAAMARPKAENPRVAERFELYCAGVELCNGYGELTDPAEQAARMHQEVQSRLALGQSELPIDQRFISALHEGLPPSSGNALGFDRLVMLAAGAPMLADVVAFPWDRN
jgi:elongation factor P--(R)-beta-lysine ligase